MKSSSVFSQRDRVLKPGTGKLIRNCSIAVFGVGALGNAVLQNLVLQGFRKFLIADLDVVEDSNLTKSPLFTTEDIGKPKAKAAADALRRLSLTEDIEVQWVNGNIMTDVGKAVFWDYQVVVCAVDTMDCRAYINDWCVRAGTPLFIEGGFSGRSGDISFFVPDENGKYHHCLRQLIGQGDFDGKRNSCSDLKVKDTGLDIIPVIQPTSAIAGAYIAQEIVKFLEGTSTLLNKTLFFNGMSLVNTIMTHGTCTCALHTEAPVDLFEVTIPAKATVGQVIQAATEQLGSEQMLILPETYYISGRCHCCGKLMNIERRKSQIWDNDRWCHECRSTNGYETMLKHSSEWRTVSELTLQSDTDLLNRTLEQLGIPENDVLLFKSSIDDEIVCRYVRLKEEPAKPKPFVISKTETSNHPPFMIEEGADKYYDSPEDNSLDRHHLSCAIDTILAGGLNLDTDDGYNCFIEKAAFNQFVEFANDVYLSTGNEATGIFAGYWLADNNGNRYAYCTHFVPAYGDKTPVTCTIEPKDFSRISEFCRQNKLTQLVWVHSHPGFGAFFSDTDNNTLSTLFRAPQHMGIVVDICKNEMAGYKMVDGLRITHNFHII